jgi:thymidylate kinase
MAKHVPMSAGGIQDSALGNDYQFDLLLLCAHQSVESGIKFKLSTEQKDAGKFDDLVLKIEEKSGKTRYIFGQAKHKVRAGNFEFQTIMESNNFKLSKYFESWDEILMKYSNTEKDILIITNNRIDTQKTQSSGLVKIDSDDKKSSLYFAEDTSDDLIFKNVGKLYKFPAKSAFPVERQAVFQVLKNDFANKNIGQNFSDFDDKLNSFMDQLVFVTSLELKDIEDHIKKDLQKRLQVTDVSVQYLKLEECIKSLVTGGNQQMKLITNEDYEKVLDEYELFEANLLVTEKTRTIFGNNSCLEFRTTHKTIEDFLKDPQIKQTDKILHVNTQESETKFVSMQIYGKLSTAALNKDTYIMMKTSFSEETFERGVKVFKESETFKFMIIEVDSEDSLFVKFRSQIEKIVQSPSKRMIVITDMNSKIKFTRCEELELSHFHPKDLTDASLAEVLNRKVEFQKTQTTWKELAEEDYLKNKVLLKHLLTTNKIAENVEVSKEIDVSLYVPRTFLYQNWLKPEVLKALRSDEIVYNQQDYGAQCRSRNVHWLEKDGETLKWMKTSRDNSEILKYIIKEKEEPIGEDSMISMTQRISILIDIAGMGKSTVLNQLAQKLKKKYENHWVVKVDLNDHTSELEEVESDQLKSPKEAIEFLSEKILKLSSAFEKDLFRKSCMETGNIIVLFDGYDEVASFYQKQVTQLVKVLLETSVEKIFIASRPECADYLEKEFLQIRHSLQPFSKKNQESYLFKFMKENIKNLDADSLKKIIGTILGLMLKSLSDQDYKFTGVPLITKLVAEFFESKICVYFQGTNQSFDNFTEKLGTETFNLVQLYDHFVEKKLQVFYEVKCEMNPLNPRANRMIQQGKQTILDNFETLAVQEVLKTDLEKHLPKFRSKKIDEDELEVLVQVGLIYQIGKDFKFSHQTYGELGFNKFLRNNFDDEDCAKFISEVVLVYESYKIIRAFVNFWILEKIGEKTCAMYQEKLLESSGEGRWGKTPLHVAGKEGNQNIFWFLCSSLAAKTENFENKKSEIQRYFLKLDIIYFGYTAIVYYFRHCDDSFDLLNAIQRDFGSGFVRNLFTLKMFAEENLLYAICQSDFLNIQKNFNFLLECFSNDPEFLKQLFLSRDRYGRSFLHRPFECLKNERLLELLEELEKLKSNPEFGQDFVKELVLMGSGADGVFLSCYALSKFFDNDFLLEVLKQLKFLCGEETLREFFLVVDLGSRTLLHIFCVLTKNFDLLQTLKWVAEELGQEFLLKLISMKTGWAGETIFHFFISSERQSNPAQKFLKILEFLRQDFGLENKVLLDILSIKKYDKKNFLNLICDRKDQKITEILDFLSKVFQNDRDSLEKLFNRKLRENEEVKEWMGKNNFNLDLFEGSDDNSESDEESD